MTSDDSLPKEPFMRVATWNLNHRVGMVPFNHQAASAAISLGADVLVFTEFYPGKNESIFRSTLEKSGWEYQLMSNASAEKANRILMASKHPILPLDVGFPTFDRQFPSNLLGATVPLFGIDILGVRVPWYEGKETNLCAMAWDWIEATALSLKDTPSVICGDLNITINGVPSRGGDHLRRILDNGWHRPSPSGWPTYFSARGAKTEIDHILATNHCILKDAACVQNADGFSFAGSPDAISDHAPLLCRVVRRQFRL